MLSLSCIGQLKRSVTGVISLLPAPLRLVPVRAILSCIPIQRDLSGSAVAHFHIAKLRNTSEVVNDAFDSVIPSIFGTKTGLLHPFGMAFHFVTAVLNQSHQSFELNKASDAKVRGF